MTFEFHPEALAGRFEVEIFDFKPGHFSPLICSHVAAEPLCSHAVARMSVAADPLLRRD